MMGAETEMDLLKSTADFFESIKKRLSTDLANVNRFMRRHFQTRWDSDRDIYMEAAERNVAYLDYLMSNHERDYRKKLKRGGVLNEIKRREFGDE
jgi:prophage DNA circulation protein